MDPMHFNGVLWLSCAVWAMATENSDGCDGARFAYQGTLCGVGVIDLVQVKEHKMDGIAKLNGMKHLLYLSS